MALFFAGRHDQAPSAFSVPQTQKSSRPPCSDRHVVEREGTGNAVWQARPRSMDSLDPELWKRIAAVASSWHAILTSIVFVVGLVGAAIKWGPRWARWVASKFWSAKNSPAESPPPAERSSPAESPLRFVIDEQRSFWGPVKSGDLPGTQVSGNWHVTNVSDRDIVFIADVIFTDNYRGA